MSNKPVIVLVLALSFLLGSVSVAAQAEVAPTLPDNVPQLLIKANEAYVAQDYLGYSKVLERLREMRPNNSEYMYQLVIAYALTNNKPKAYELMLSMQQQGLAYDFSLADTTRNIRGTEVFDYVNDLMKMAGTPIGESELVFTLPESIKAPEAIAWDASRGVYLVGTSIDGSIVSVTPEGETKKLLEANSENGMWAVFDLLVDQPRNRLWVSSASIPGFSGFDPIDAGRSGLFEFNLETLELMQHYPVPVDGRPHILGKMVINKEGDIFIADRLYPFLFKKPANEQKIKAVMALRNMISMRGIAMQPDGRIMYLADREMGIMVVDIEAGRAGALQLPANFNPGGIDGLYLWKNRLVIIQNGIKPQRVMRLQLDASGTRVESVRPLAVAQPGFDHPSFGTIKGEDLIYFANSQVVNGKVNSQPVSVFSTPLDSSADLAVPDMEEYFMKRGEKQEAERAKKDKN
jgi:sugar lactone lactonase YvrE